jgi:hypothetical protein
MAVEKRLFISRGNDVNLEKDMKEIKKKYPQMQILFVILSLKGHYTYGKVRYFRNFKTLILSTLIFAEIVKRVGDLDLRLTTQCVQYKNVVGKADKGPDRSTLANICLKLNAKLGGTNNLIARESRYVAHRSLVIV